MEYSSEFTQENLFPGHRGALCVEEEVKDAAVSRGDWGGLGLLDLAVTHCVSEEPEGSLSFRP